MKKNYSIFLLTFLITCCFSIVVKGQTLPIPADQGVVVIDETVPGKLETIINGDVDEDGMRVNPNRIYMLKAGAVYSMISPINFGGGVDTASTLTIMGEEDGPYAMILMDPGAGNPAWSNVVTGNLTIKNLFYGATNLNGEGTAVWAMRGNGIRIKATNYVVENQFSGDHINARSVKSGLKLYLSNCYFRDFSQLANSWNFSVLARGDNGEAIDTLWVENTTISLSGMPFFGKLNTVNFLFLNHNLFINGTKYPVWFERFKEAYITNNMYINSNYEGECRSTWETQIGEDFVRGGLIRMDTVEANWFSPSINMDEVKFYAADNLSYTSEYLDKYWSGGYNSVANYPISNRVWGSVTDNDIPLQVYGPVPLFSERELALEAAYENVKFERNHENVNPQMVTEGIANQAVGDEFAKFIRNNYGVAELGETFDRSVMYFGDADPITIPGGGAENGYSITDMSDIPEDFSYTSEIRSAIDGKHLGSLAWYPSELASYDGDAALAAVKSAYEGNLPSAIEDVKQSENRMLIYPNPASNHFSLNMNVEALVIYNALGAQVMKVENYQSGSPVSTASLRKGLYFLSDGNQMQKLIIQ